jgi:hypothetical protein
VVDKHKSIDFELAHRYRHYDMDLVNMGFVVEEFVVDMFVVVGLVVVVFVVVQIAHTGCLEIVADSDSSNDFPH